VENANRGALLFLPDALVRRTIAGADWLAAAEQWVHPDLSGDAADSFCAAALLYRILCGVEPFPAKDIETLHLDMREGNFLPPALAAPGLDQTAAALIAGALSGGRLGPMPKTPGEFLRPRASETGPTGETEPAAAGRAPRAASYFTALSDEARAKIVLDREKYEKKRGSAVKTRRFIKRNTAILGGIAVGVLLLGLIAGSLIADRSKLPTTRDMSPREVVESYYYAMENLDHTMMEACVLKDTKTGKEDIGMIVNLTVMTKVRQAYERERGYIPAREWLEAGSPPTEAMIFGLTELRIHGQPGSESAAVFEAAYTIWLPGGENQLRRDELRLVLYKNAWRIAEITRK
jgi:hypothetical protein